MIQRHIPSPSLTLLIALAAGCADSCGEAEQKDDTGACPTWYFDRDGDGYGQDERAVVSCEQPQDHAPLGGDCDDTTDDVHPEAPELCDRRDNDCDGDVDEDLEQLPWHPDADGDGYGDPEGEPVTDCGPPSGYGDEPTDCDDGDPAVHPGADETLCDGVDSDCDGAGEQAVGVWDGAEYTSVEEAVAAAERGGEVLVCPGRHDTQLELAGGSQLTLASWSGDPVDTVLTGGATHRIILVEPGSSLTVRGLGLEEGYTEVMSPTYSYRGGSAIMAEDSDLIMESCVVRENTGSWENDVGAVAVYMAQDSDWEARELTVRDCLFESNESRGCSSLSYYTQGVGGSGYVTIEGSTFQDNTAGGGVVVLYGAHNPNADFIALVESCTFARNNANYTLGLGHDGEYGTLDVSNCSFEDNSGIHGYSGSSLSMSVEDGAIATVSACSFVDNEAIGDVGGGAISLFPSGDASLVEITGCSFEDNTAHDGGAIDIEFIDGQSSVVIYDSTFTGNSASYRGGAIHHHTRHPDDQPDTLLFDGCTFSGNWAGHGGAIDGEGIEAAVAIMDCLFEENTADYGAASHNDLERLELEITDSSFLNNSAFLGGAVRLNGMQTDADIQDSHFEGNTARSVAGGAAIEVNSIVVSPTLALARTSFHSNSSTNLAAVLVSSRTELESEEVDWGTGSLDNSVADLCVGENERYTCNDDLGASESFTCPGDGTCGW